MDYVQVDGVYRTSLLTVDNQVYPGTASFPDAPLDEDSVNVTVGGIAASLPVVLTTEAETGLHTITVDCSGVDAGAYVEISGEYEVDSVRYIWSSVVFVADATQAAARDAAIAAAAQTTAAALKSGARAALTGTWTDEGANTFDLTVADTA